MTEQIAAAGLIARVKNILLKPEDEWGVIDSEPASIGGIYVKYVILLAAIGPVCAFVRGVLFGYSAFGVTFKPSFFGALTQSLTSYVMALIAPFVLALIIDGLAPSFGGTPNRVQAFKVAAYASTAAWVAGIFGLIPGLGILGILALYSFYLLYRGLPRLMQAPQDKAMPYTVVTIVAAIVLVIAAAAISRAVAPVAPSLADAGAVSGTIAIPGVGSLDMGSLNKVTKDLEVATKRMEDGKPMPAIEPAKLQALLPAAIGGMTRTEMSSSSAGAGGMNASTVEARYGKGDGSIALKLTDMSAFGALAGLGAAFNVESSKEDADGYEKVAKVDGRMVTEKWRMGDKSGSYGIIVANRFMVEADGRGTTMDALKGAVTGVGFDKLEALAQ